MPLLEIAILLTCATPADEVRAALADIRSNVQVQDRCHTRYLSLYTFEPEARPRAAAIVSFVLNSVSRAATIVLPEPVPGTEGRLLRISLARYQLPADAWEAIAAEDPYWHLRTRVADPQNGKVTEVFTDGGWVPLPEASRLRALSVSGGAVLRADFFVARAATTVDGGFYYRLTGIADREAEFFNALGLNVKTIGQLRADEGANLFYSQVTRKVRRLVRRQGPLGGAWQSYDVETSTAERDPIRNPFRFTYDAAEHIAAQSNGLHRFALYDARGNRQESVPDRIAKDSSDPHGDGIVAPMISCVRCHVEDGLRPFSNDQRRLLAGDLDLFTEKPRDAERLAAFYDTDLAKDLRRDREDYADAVAAATGGMASAEVAAALADVYRGYVHQLVTPEQAARELGVDVAAMIGRLSVSDDPVILALCDGIAVQRRQWEASFAQAAVLVKGQGSRVEGQGSRVQGQGSRVQGQR